MLASLVVFEHAFFLTANSPAGEPLYRLTSGQVHSGQLAVYMFFSVSGFLVARSRLQSDLIGYSLKRILRIAPGFIVATLLGLFVLGPAVAGHDYFSQQRWPGLLAGMLALKQVNPAGTFAGNPVDLVHGTLWSIRYEFDCYILIAVLGTFGLLSGRRAAAAFIVIAALLAASMIWPLPRIDHGWAYLLVSSPDGWGRLFAFFFAGSAFYIWRDRIPKSPWLLTASLLAIAITAVTGGLYWALVFGGTYVALYAALSLRFEPKIAGRKVDLSYGIYLYGWPVEQLLIRTVHPAPWLLFVEALAITAGVALVSWTFVEGPALRLAHKARRRPRPSTAGVAAES